MSSQKSAKESQSESPVERIPKGYQQHTLYRQDPDSGEISIEAGFLVPRGINLDTLWEEYVDGFFATDLKGNYQLHMFRSFADWLLDEKGIQVLKSERPPAYKPPGSES